VLISHSNSLLHTGTSFPEAFTSGAQWAFWVCAGIAVVGLVSSLVLVRSEELAYAETQSAPGAA